MKLNLKSEDNSWRVGDLIKNDDNVFLVAGDDYKKSFELIDLKRSTVFGRADSLQGLYFTQRDVDDEKINGHFVEE